jgi:cytochrome c-type biogenesis protein CcmH
MTAFIIALLVLTALALIFVIPVMLRKHDLEADQRDQLNIRIAKDRLADLKQERDNGQISQEAFEQAREELENNLALDLAQGEEVEVDASKNIASSKPMAVFLLLAVPALAVLIYSQIGSYNLVDMPVAQQSQPQPQQQQPQMSLEDAIAGLEQRLQQQPDNLEGWFMLGRTYAAINQFDKAAAAFKQIIDREGEKDADLLLRYADALAMVQNGHMTADALSYVEKALTIDPQHPQGLWMMGMGLAEQGRYEEALNNWYKVLPQLQDDASIAQIERMIANAEQELDADALQRVKQNRPAPQAAPAAASAAQIEVTVSLDDALRDKVSPDDTVFIFARAVNGPPMPLAAVRQRVADLPITLVLDDSMAMMPAMKLSQYPEVTVGAKISKSGTAGPAAGDLFGEISPVKVVGAPSLQLVIEKIRQ